MFTSKNKSRWIAIRAVRRNIRIDKPDSAYLAILPPSFQRAITESFLDMAKESTVGSYNQLEKRINLIDSNRKTKRHEVMHAINHHSSLFPACARFFPFPVRLAARFMACKSSQLITVGFIMNESIAQWVEGNKSFFFDPNIHYLRKARIMSPIIAWVWFFLPIVLKSTLFIIGSIILYISTVSLLLKLKV
jgi:hypothetical protein